MTTTPGQETVPPAADAAAGAPGQPIVCVITSESDAVRAEQLARELVDRGLAGCVSLVPMTSIYFWEGRLEHSGEVQLLIKTSPCRLEELHRVVLALHSYDTPMWVQWSAQADGGYGGWLAQVTARPSGLPPAGADSPENGVPAG
ncbi:MAG: divalent-cation tolerance protein CutA [Synechococcaceae cyanobacterium]|nr:divalent-cation tolerance protein CutA [Synechococcaceae cyanobacterium]